MSTTLDLIIPVIQPMVVAKLNSEPFFATIAIFAVKEKQISSQILKSLGGTGGNVQGQSGKKSGATIEVLMPEFGAPKPDSPGPTTTVEQRFRVKTQETVNLGAYGSKITPEAMAGRIAQTFHKFFFGDKHLAGFYAAPDYYRRIHSGYDATTGDLNPFVTIEVTLNATLVPDELPQTNQPGVSCPAETVTLTDTQPGGGSALYYATGYGQFPGPGNPGATLYTVPFTVASGTVVNVAAYNPPLCGSMVASFTVN
jgi:hypothetical protein